MKTLRYAVIFMTFVTCFTTKSQDRIVECDGQTVVLMEGERTNMAIDQRYIYRNDVDTAYALIVGHFYSPEEELYTIVDGKIIARPEYVDTLSGSEKARGYGEYRLVCREVDAVNVVELYKYAYSDFWKKVLEENPDAIEDGGDIQIISIMNRLNKKFVYIEYFNGWTKSHWESMECYRTEEDCYFVTIPVSPTSIAYLFFECSYEQPGYVTVVLVFLRTTRICNGGTIYGQRPRYRVSKAEYGKKDDEEFSGSIRQDTLIGRDAVDGIYGKHSAVLQRCHSGRERQAGV